jgi:hypothetical protein
MSDEAGKDRLLLLLLPPHAPSLERWGDGSWIRCPRPRSYDVWPARDLPCHPPVLDPPPFLRALSRRVLLEGKSVPSFRSGSTLPGRWREPTLPFLFCRVPPSPLFLFLVLPLPSPSSPPKAPCHLSRLRRPPSLPLRLLPRLPPSDVRNRTRSSTVSPIAPMASTTRLSARSNVVSNTVERVPTLALSSSSAGPAVVHFGPLLRTRGRSRGRS